MTCDQGIKNRVKRLQGQVNGILNMMEDGRDCSEILAQLSAVRSSVERVIALTATNNLLDEIEKNEGTDNDGVQKAIDLLVKSK